MKAMNEVIPTARDTETSTSAMTVSNLNGTGFDIGSLGMAHSETGAPFRKSCGSIPIRGRQRT